MTSPSCHSRSRSHAFFDKKTFDKKEIEQCGWSQCVPPAETHSLICNMTYLGHNVTSRDPDLRSNFDLEVSRLKCIYFDMSWQEEHDSVRIISLAFLVQKVFAKTIFVKNVYFDVSWSLKPNLLNIDQFWMHVRERASQELPIALSGSLLPIIVSDIAAHFRKVWNFA